MERSGLLERPAQRAKARCRPTDFSAKTLRLSAISGPHQRQRSRAAADKVQVGQTAEWIAGGTSQEDPVGRHATRSQPRAGR